MLHKDYGSKGSVEKSLVVSLKGLDAKTDWRYTVSRKLTIIMTLTFSVNRRRREGWEAGVKWPRVIFKSGQLKVRL
jgi:predicted membrane GTPase involved in stress response